MTHGEAIKRLNGHHQRMMRWGVRVLAGALQAKEALMPDTRRYLELGEEATILAAELEDGVAARAEVLPERIIAEHEWRAFVHAMDQAFVKAVLTEALKIARGVGKC